MDDHTVQAHVRPPGSHVDLDVARLNSKVKAPQHSRGAPRGSRRAPEREQYRAHLFHVGRIRAATGEQVPSAWGQRRGSVDAATHRTSSPLATAAVSRKRVRPRPNSSRRRPHGARKTPAPARTQPAAPSHDSTRACGQRVTSAIAGRRPPRAESGTSGRLSEVSSRLADLPLCWWKDRRSSGRRRWAAARARAARRGARPAKRVGSGPRSRGGRAAREAAGSGRGTGAERWGPARRAAKRRAAPRAERGFAS